MNFREMIDLIEKLSIEDQDKLFELVIKRRAEALAYAQRVSVMRERIKAKEVILEPLKPLLFDDDFCL
jgi:hypothetical protein